MQVDYRNQCRVGSQPSTYLVHNPLEVAQVLVKFPIDMIGGYAKGGGGGGDLVPTMPGCV